MKNTLITGTAGFIASKVSELLLAEGGNVIGIDNLNDYYDRNLKLWRLENLLRHGNFKFYEADIENLDAMRTICRLHMPDAIINEAARAGVRYSLQNPFIYLRTNAIGCLNLLELCREFNVPKFILASTSSLYAGQGMPFKEDLAVNTPVSPYAASKKSAEVMAYTYHYLYGIDVTVLRYFTVYGPAGRPDMSIFRFVKQVMEGSPIEVMGDGLQTRDFTYIDDIARGTLRGLRPLGYEVINLGNSRPETLLRVIELIENEAGKKAGLKYREFHKADMPATWADISKAERLLNWHPETGIEEGIKKTVEWTKNNWQWIKNIKL